MTDGAILDHEDICEVAVRRPLDMWGADRIEGMAALWVQWLNGPLQAPRARWRRRSRQTP